MHFEAVCVESKASCPSCCLFACTARLASRLPFFLSLRRHKAPNIKEGHCDAYHNYIIYRTDTVFGTRYQSLVVGSGLPRISRNLIRGISKPSSRRAIDLGTLIALCYPWPWPLLRTSVRVQFDYRNSLRTSICAQIF